MAFMQLPQWLARFNRYVTNPVQRMWAGRADWRKNIVSAGGGRMRRYGKTIELTDPRVVPRSQAAQSVTGLWRPLFTRLPFEQARCC
jgi:hypothetical protein